MDFEWDENKNETNRRKHGISFEIAARALLDPYAMVEPDGYEFREDRWRLIGSIGGDIVLFVVYVDRDSDDEEITRLISARYANSRERKRYEQNKMGQI